MSSTFFMYFSIMHKSDCTMILLITTMTSVRSKHMKSTKTSDFKFLNDWLMLVMWRELFFINLVILLLFIGMIICFLDGSLVVIWIYGLAFGLPLTILWIWLIFLASRAGKFSLILITSDMLIPCLETCMYNFGDCLEMLTSLIFLKYLKIWLTSFCDLVEIRGGIFLILTGIGLLIDLLFLLDGAGTLGVNFTKNFCLSEFKFLSAISKSYLD